MRDFFKHLCGPSMTPEGKRAHRWFSVAIIVLYWVISLFIPDTILRDHAWTREFADFMAVFVPQIDRVTVLGIAPEFNRFYFSFIWATSWPLFFLFYNSFKQDVALGLYPPQKTITINLMLKLSLGGFFVSIGMFLWLYSPEERIVQRFFGGHFARGINGAIHVIGLITCIAFYMAIVRSILRRQIKIKLWEKITW